MTAGAWCAVWPAILKAKPIYRHYFLDGEDPWRLRPSESLCSMIFEPGGLWALGSTAITMSGSECTACRARLDELERGTE